MAEKWYMEMYVWNLLGDIIQNRAILLTFSWKTIRQLQTFHFSKTSNVKLQMIDKSIEINT